MIDRARHGCLTLLRRAVLACVPLSIVAVSAAAQPAKRCDDNRKVRGIAFSGSPLFDDATLSANIATPAPGFLARVLHLRGFPCSDSLEVELDALRIAVMHRQKGYLEAQVVAGTNQSPKGVRIRFDITPGEPSLLDTIVISGLPEDRASLANPLRALQGQRFDRVRIDTTITSVLTRLRDVGYARVARPTTTVSIDSTTLAASMTLAFEPGTRTTIGALHVEVQGFGTGPPTVDSSTVRKLTSLQAGALYRASDVVRAQRDLYRADVFRLVLVDTLSVKGQPDSVIDLKISVAESRTRNARVGLGWATLECVRTQARFVDRRFLGVGNRLELTARASRIGVGAPADFAPSICTKGLRADTQFTVLNHYLGATVSSTRLFGSPLSPVTTIYTERRSEPYAYVREITIGTIVELSKRFSDRTSGTGGFQYENGRTKVDPAESCSRFGLCRQEEYEQSVFGRGVGVVSTAISHDRTNSAIDATRGFRVRSELRAGQTFSNAESTVRFYRGSADGTTYLRALGGVFAVRAQGARVIAPGAQLVDGSPLIPQQERLYAGGQSTVRGYQQNLLGPLLYVVSRVDTTENAGVTVVEAASNASSRSVPRGGTGLAVANFEYRRGFRWLSEQLQVVAFVDVGNVWEGGSFRMQDLRTTPGMGLRMYTALGPFRVDVGYQPYNPRPGRALYLARGSNGSGGAVQCASPGNRVAIDRESPGSIFDCPQTYLPSGSRSTLSRLTFHFGLGQAF